MTARLRTAVDVKRRYFDRCAMSELQWVVAELISDVPKKLIARAAKERDLLTDQVGPAESK